MKLKKILLELDEPIKLPSRYRKLEIGKIVSIPSKVITGKLDKQSYNVIELVSGVRGGIVKAPWATKSPVTLTAKIVDIFRTGNKLLARIEFTPKSLKVPVTLYTVKPYVRKSDGTHKPHLLTNDDGTIDWQPLRKWLNTKEASILLSQIRL